MSSSGAHIQLKTVGIPQVDRAAYKAHLFNDYIKVVQKDVDNETLDEVKALTKTWKHRVSWVQRVVSRHTGYFTETYTEDEIYGYWEKGTRPHEIHSRNAKALRWYNLGDPVFAKRVRHPGTHGHFALPPISKRMHTLMVKLAEEAIRNAARDSGIMISGGI